jgi:hypothetical protein
VRHPGEAATVCEGDGHGNDRDDQVRQRELSKREYRQVKGAARLMQPTIHGIAPSSPLLRAMVRTY